MSTPEPSSPPSFGHALRMLVASDRLAQVALAASVTFAVFWLLPVVPVEQKRLVVSWFVLPFVTLIFSAFLWGRSAIGEREERCFWNHLTAGFGMLVLATVFYTIPTAGSGLPAWLVSVGENVGLAAVYFFFVLASECEPDRPGRPASSRFEAWITWPAAGIFVLGFLVYFTLLPPLHGSPTGSTPLETVCLFLALDTYLVVRFALLARFADAPRWRFLYGVWALTFSGFLLDDVLQLVARRHPDLDELVVARYVLWLIPHLLAALAARLRYQPFLQPVPVPVRGDGASRDARLPAASSRTLVFALGFPTVHLLFHQLELLDPAQKPARTVVAFGWMLLLGLVALAQARLLDRRAAEIWDERKRFEARLSSSEDDLRLILERRRVEHSLRVAEDRFERIFRVCPDAVVITDEKDGRVIDVNAGFERATGFEREQALGRTFAEIGLGSYPDGREGLIRQLEERGGALELEIHFRNRGGRLRIARLLLDRVTIGGERCLITIARDITERRRLEAEREKQAALLDNASAAIYALDGEERVSFWNRSAEQLFGQKAGETLGHPVGAFARAVRPDVPIAVDLWSTAILDDQGRPAGRLVVAGEARIS